jgi:uncharacterized protein (TIGR03067 family)
MTCSEKEECIMRRNFLSIVLSLVLLAPVGSAFSADVGGEDATKELAKFQGTWVLVSSEIDGKKASDEHVKKSKIVYEGNKITATLPNQSPEPILAEVVKIDPGKNPKELHFLRKSGPSAGKVLIAAYAFQGDDQFDFIFDPAAIATLKEFVTKEGTGHVRNTWKRVKP